MMTELFLVNYTDKREDGTPSTAWKCSLSTISLRNTTARAKELREDGYIVNVQSIWIDEDGRVKL